MKKKAVSIWVAALVLVVCGGLAVFLLSRWFAYDPSRDLTDSRPGTDGGPAESERAAATEVQVNLAGKLETFDGRPSNLPGSWPRFRGADFDNICKDNVKLADRWPESGPKILWSVKLGEGHAAPAVLNGCVYLFDYDEAKRADALRCFSPLPKTASSLSVRAVMFRASKRQPENSAGALICKRITEPRSRCGLPDSAR